MNVKAFYEVLSQIIGDKNGVNITAEVIENETICTPTAGIERNGSV